MINKSIYSKTLTNDNKIILANVRNGNYIKTNLTYFNYIDESIKKNGYLNLEDVPSNLNRKNLVVLFNALQDIEFYLSKEEEANSLDIAFLAVTNKCNLECLHCSANSNPHGNEGLSRDNIFNIINQLETLKVPNLNITGGEPLIRKDIMKILDYTRKHYSGHITLSSNGLLFNEENVKNIIPLVDEISISVDGYDEETCSLVRGKGVFNKVINCIILLKNNNFSKLSLSMLSSRYTDNNEDEFYALCKSLEVYPLIHRFTPNGRGATNIDLLFSEKTYLENSNTKERKPKLCFPGEREIFIDAIGDVYPCGNLADSTKLIMGNIKKSRLDNILSGWRQSKEIEAMRPWQIKKCKDCNVNLFCHSCISNIINIKNNTDIFEDMCKVTYKGLYKTIWES